MIALLHFVLVALGGCVLGSLAGAALGTAVRIMRMSPEEWHWMQHTELERRREWEAFCEEMRSARMRRDRMRDSKGVAEVTDVHHS